jgi:hypothetical protein
MQEQMSAAERMAVVSVNFRLAPLNSATFKCDPNMCTERSLNVH